jgi:predicted XRE-type DNA-binding protein
VTKKLARKVARDRSKFKYDKQGTVTLETPEELAEFLGLSPTLVFAQRFKGELVDKIIGLVKKQKITHAALAERVGTSRPKITMIMNNRAIGISTDLLVRVLGTLGYQAHLTVKKIAN